MDRSKHYCDGQEIHIGDNILYNDEPAKIVFVIGWDEFEGEFADQKDWYKKEYKRGFMTESGSLGLVLHHEADEDMKLLSRQE